MADRTLFNEDLTLSSLTISNSTSSNASGYVPKSVTITPVGLTTDLVVTSEVVLTGSGTTVTPLIQTSGNSVLLTTANSSGLILNTSAGNTSLITSGTSLICSDTFNAPAFGITNGANNIGLECLAPATLTVGGTCNASDFGITNGATAVSLTCSSPNVLTVQNINVPQVASVSTVNVTNSIGFLGSSGNGVLSISANGSQLFFNGVQIN